MANINLSPNMNLPIPTTGVDPGPDWANNLNSSLGVIDAHTHSSGSGVRITPDGININADLPFNGNDATLMRTSRYSVQSALLSDPTDIGCVYVSGLDLYYNDIAGNQVRITQSGGVAGSPGSISNLTSPASAAYVGASHTFVWESDASTAANMDGGSVIIREVLANAKGITISSPASLANNYTMTLMSALPASQKIMTVSNTGSVASAYDVDNVTIEVATNLIQVKDNGITPDKMGLINFEVSSNTVGPNFTNTTFLDVSVLTATITTFGNPVWVGLIPYFTGSENSSINISALTGVGSYAAQIQIKRDGTAICQHNIAFDSDYIRAISWPTTGVFQIDTAIASTPGTYVYIVAVKVNSGTNLNLADMKLIAYEL